MDLLIELFAAGSRLMSFVNEPVAMLLWGLALMALCSVLQRTAHRNPSNSPNPAEAQLEAAGLDANLNGVPSFASRS